jgi:hypothetical protein
MLQRKTLWAVYDQTIYRYYYYTIKNIVQQHTEIFR